MNAPTLLRGTLLTAVCLAVAGCVGALTQPAATAAALPYAIVDTGQAACYDARSEIDCPRAGDAFYGQDAQHEGNPPRYADHGDGTVTDGVTGLMWQQAYSGKMTYAQAVASADGFALAGYDDWRLPNAKELQSLVDYGRAPDATGSPALDPVFEASELVNEAGQRDWGYDWTSTTHASVRGGQAAVYVAFGRALGYLNGRWSDVHGAGAQRSDPKAGSASQYPSGNGPQDDAVRIDNLVRAVRGP